MLTDWHALLSGQPLLIRSGCRTCMHTTRSKEESTLPRLLLPREELLSREALPPPLPKAARLAATTRLLWFTRASPTRNSKAQARSALHPGTSSAYSVVSQERHLAPLTTRGDCCKRKAFTARRPSVSGPTCSLPCPVLYAAPSRPAFGARLGG